MSSGYFDRGASAGGSDEGYFDREDITGPSGVGSATGGPGGVADRDLEVDQDNPNIVRAVPERDVRLDETAGVTSTQREDAYEGSYPDVVEGSDSAATGTSWGQPGSDSAAAVQTPSGALSEGEGEGEASPTRNASDNPTRDELDNVGSWSTIDNADSAGSPTGFS